jgi:hypothetical protein
MSKRPTTVRLDIDPEDRRREQIDAYCHVKRVSQSGALRRAWDHFWPTAKAEVEQELAAISRRLEGEDQDV